MKKLLIANRGEIALRVMKTARRMGIATVAVYSDADREAPHVLAAQEAVHIGPSPASQSYLVIEHIIEAVQKTGADAIHPGYGFLSENADFARAVADAGLTFVGPSVHAIEVMGSKLAAKDAVKSYNIPMVPGTDHALEDAEEAMGVARSIGFPVLIKASAGGGGKGMRVVEHEDELPDQMARAISEAESAFGDGSVFIEKYVVGPRHIEIQVLADQEGNTVHLFERECSIQRRHQKVIEEAPSAIMTSELRARMGDAAVNVAKACGYVGAGTVEFLVDAERNFYFLEMNTRLQVEHPVTEMITGLDLVEQQLRVARGETLSFGQDDLRITGHAIELRVYAEDPANDFLPSTGLLTRYRPPEGDGIRVDDGFREGMEVPVFYDPMLSKLVVHASNRAGAIEALRLAIAGYEVEGVETTLPFGAFVLNHEAFCSGEFDTGFVSQFFDPALLTAGDETEARIAALMALRLHVEEADRVKPVDHQATNWKRRTQQV